MAKASVLRPMLILEVLLICGIALEKLLVLYDMPFMPVGAAIVGFIEATVNREVWIPSIALVLDCIFNVLS